MLIEYDLFGEKHDKVQDAIDLLRRMSTVDPQGLYVAFSGGKDSQCIYHLCKMAGVKFDAHYALTTVDPPELVRFIKEHYPDAWEGRHIRRREDGTPYTMWNLIPEMLIPPTRVMRYCCKVLKEAGGEGRVTVTGVRWAESVNRKRNQGVVTVIGASKKDTQQMEEAGADFTSSPRGGVVLNNDNEATRDVVEMCYQRRKTVINPIITWSDEDVWEFLNTVAKVPHCELYDQGYKRLGCIGCPMSNTEAELERYPKYRQSYIRAFERMLEVRKEKGLKNDWQSGEDVMAWWLGKAKDDSIEGQISIEELT